MSSLMITGTQWLAMASKNRFEEGVSPAMLRQNLEDLMPLAARRIPSPRAVPKEKWTSFSSLSR